MLNAMRAIIARDLTLAWRRKADVFIAVLFFVIVASLFPLGIGPEPPLLRAIGPGVVWVAALQVMLDKGITNHESAAEYWQWMKQAAAPTPSGYNPNAMGKFDLGKYWKNPVAGARDEAAKALAELRKNPRPIGL